MAFEPSKVADLVKESLKSVQIGKGEAELQNGKDFYKFFFTNFPDLRKYFKGAENFTATEVQASERFEKQGARLLLAMYLLANTFENEEVFRAYARETVNRHRIYKMDPALWSAFFTVYVAFLDSRSKLTDETKAAWAQMGKVFDDECQKHLTDLGLPHV